MPEPLATICVIHYRTLELTKLCLRSIRKFTPPDLYRVIVVDNHSADSSLEYLRSLRWIELIERTDANLAAKPAVSHATALDLGFEHCQTPFFISMHSDTFVHRPGWLERMISPFERDPLMACVGGGKLDLKPRWQVLLKKYTDVKAWIRALNPREKARMEFYVRTICSAYRADFLRKYNLHFHMGFERGMTAAQEMYYELCKAGCHAEILQEYEMASWLHHLAHATMVLNPEFSVRKHTDEVCRKRLLSVWNSPLTKSILSDESLDR